MKFFFFISTDVSHRRWCKNCRDKKQTMSLVTRQLELQMLERIHTQTKTLVQNMRSEFEGLKVAKDAMGDCVDKLPEQKQFLYLGKLLGDEIGRLIDRAETELKIADQAQAKARQDALAQADGEKMSTAEYQAAVQSAEYKVPAQTRMLSVQSGRATKRANVTQAP